MTKTDAGTLCAQRHDDKSGKGLGLGFYGSRRVAFFECDKASGKARLMVLDWLAEKEGIEVVHVKDEEEYEKILG